MKCKLKINKEISFQTNNYYDDSDEVQIIEEINNEFDNNIDILSVQQPPMMIIDNNNELNMNQQNLNNNNNQLDLNHNDNELQIMN